MLSVGVLNPLRTLLVFAYFLRHSDITEVTSSKIKPESGVVVIATTVTAVVRSRTD